MRSCSDYPQIFKPLGDPMNDKFNYCIKLNGKVSKLANEGREGWEPVGDAFIEPCHDGWVRIGTR